MIDASYVCLSMHHIQVYAREFTVRDDAGSTYIHVGAKAVASVEMAVCVPPTMVAGELSVESSEGETSGEDFRDGDRRSFGHRRLTTSSGLGRQDGATLAGKQSSKNLYMW